MSSDQLGDEVGQRVITLQIVAAVIAALGAEMARTSPLLGLGIWMMAAALFVEHSKHPRLALRRLVNRV